MRVLVALLFIAVVFSFPIHTHAAPPTPAPTVAPIKPTTEIDSDGDGASDAWELALGTDPNNRDSDSDGYTDGEEITTGHDPKSADVAKLNKRIVVSLKNQKLAYYLGDAMLEEFPISSGLPKMPTPPGTYAVLMKKPVVRYLGVGYDFPNTKWNLMFKPGKTGNYYIHGAYWHNKFGTPRSHGCVNVAYGNMERLYNWADQGTPITIE